MTEPDALRYPIGRFRPLDAYTPELRREPIHTLRMPQPRGRWRSLHHTAHITGLRERQGW